MFNILNHQGNAKQTTLRFYCTAVRMTNIKNSGDSRCWRECGDRRTLLHCKLVQPLWKSVWWFFSKLDIVLPEDPAIPPLGIYPEDAPTFNKDTCSTMFIAALFIIAETGKNPDVPQQRNGYRKCVSFMQWSTTRYLKQWIYEILRQIDGSRGYHPERDNPIPKEHTWYALW